MAKNHPELTDAMRDEMLDAALAALANGATASKALDVGCALYHVSRDTLRRWGVSRGRPVARSTARTAAATAARSAYTLEDTRQLAHDAHRVIEDLMGRIVRRVEAAGDDDEAAFGLLPDLGRASVVLARVATLDERLDRRGAGEATEAAGAAEQDELERMAAESERQFTVMRGGKAG